MYKERTCCRNCKHSYTEKITVVNEEGNTSYENPVWKCQYFTDIHINPDIGYCLKHTAKIR